MSVNKRNIAIWKPLNTLGYMGISNQLSSYETAADNLGKSIIKIPIIIADDVIRIKEEHRDDLIRLGYDTIANQKTITDMDAETKRSIMTLDQSTNDYIMLVEGYINKVLALMADAKEYAFEVGKGVIELAEVKAEIAEEKGAIYIEEINLKIDLEEINRKHVEIELLRAELSAAKAHTRLLMAELDVKRAELRLIQVDVEKAMAELKKIQTEVDIEMILADIIIRGLAEVRYGVDAAEIAAGFEMIAGKLQAVLSVIEEKEKQIVERKNSQPVILDYVEGIAIAEREAQDKRVDAIESDHNVLSYDEAATSAVLGIEAAETDALTVSRIEEIAQFTNMSVEQDEASSWAALLIDDAQKWAARNRRPTTATHLDLTQKIHPNTSMGCKG